ncbi:DUF1127 domain-containing protein [uncultured Agrobacterium sp.]|uniref:DUF1127 domain-containing protein n=1 Tax=uncultured Agrobacterium sp. TaxID=157277 RepID=UPI00258F0E1E|nr:DUF1127 domain-containing protein [uncultured Agrobacterium sp.]
MSKELSLRVNDLSKAVDELFRSFGVWATFKAMLLGLLRRQGTKNHVSHLSDRMRRDVGLPVNEPLPGQPLLPPWFPRF